MADSKQARDIAVLDALDDRPREPFSQTVWRVVREGRDPIQGSPSIGRWSNGTFDVLYTSLTRDGAIAEMHSLLSMQPVFPSKIKFSVYQVKINADETLKIADFATLEAFGVDVSRYSERDYQKTQEIADAAYFLGFDGILAPSARSDCLNAVLFMERISPDQIEVIEEGDEINWSDWRRKKHGLDDA